MEHSGEIHHKTSSGEDIYSTKGEMTPGEAANLQKKSEKEEWEYAQQFLGKKPKLPEQEKKAA